MLPVSNRKCRYPLPARPSEAASLRQPLSAPNHVFDLSSEARGTPTTSCAINSSNGQAAYRGKVRLIRPYVRWAAGLVAELAEVNGWIVRKLVKSPKPKATSWYVLIRRWIVNERGQRQWEKCCIRVSDHFVGKLNAVEGVDFEWVIGKTKLHRVLRWFADHRSKKTAVRSDLLPEYTETDGRNSMPWMVPQHKNRFQAL